MKILYVWVWVWVLTMTPSVFGSSPTVNVTIIPILAPALGTRWEPITEAQDDVMNGKVGLHKSYQAITNPVPWRHLIRNQVGETPWPVVVCIIRLESSDGSDSVNLSMLRLNADSKGGGLDATGYRITGSGYSQYAFGVTSQGDKVTSGHQDTMVARLCLAIQFPHFAGDGSVETEKLVRNWVLSKKPFQIHYSVTAEGRTGVGHAMIETDSPRLMMTKEGLMFLGDEPGYAYDLYASESPDGPWRPVDTIYPGDKVPWNKMVDMKVKARFFRASGR